MAGFASNDSKDGKGDTVVVGEVVYPLQFCWPPNGQGDGNQKDERGTG